MCLGRYHIVLGDNVFIYDAQRKYWTRYDWNITDAFWSRGGAENESILYGLTSNDEVVRLYDSTRDGSKAIDWSYVSNPISVEDTMTLSEVYIKHSSDEVDFDDISVVVTTDGIRGTAVVGKPTIQNRFRFGIPNARGTLFEVEISGSGDPPDISEIYVEAN